MLTCFSGPPLRQRFSQRAGLRLEEARLSESPGRATVKKTSEDFEWPHPRGCSELRVTCRHQGPTVRPDPGDSCQPQSGKRGRGLSLRHRAGGQMPASSGISRPFWVSGSWCPAPLCASRLSLQHSLRPRGHRLRREGTTALPPACEEPGHSRLPSEPAAAHLGVAQLPPVSGASGLSCPPFGLGDLCPSSPPH